MNIQRDTEYRFGELVQSPEYSNEQGQVTYEYVDLGLPSGTLWAKMNVGAESETDPGLYFAWGETEGYTDASTKAFSWSDYKYGNASPYTKYDQDGLTNLELTDDAASVNMGGEWHMPTIAQCEELLNTEYVTNEWVENYNGSSINGYLFTSVSNGNTLFIPAAGGCGNGEVVGIGEWGCVWSSSLNTDMVGAALYFYFDNDQGVTVVDDNRNNGQSVRGVVGEIAGVLV